MTQETPREFLVLHRQRFLVLLRQAQLDGLLENRQRKTSRLNDLTEQPQFCPNSGTACFLAAVLLREFSDGFDGFPHARFVDLVNFQRIADSVEHRQSQSTA